MADDCWKGCEGGEFPPFVVLFPLFLSVCYEFITAKWETSKILIFPLENEGKNVYNYGEKILSLHKEDF